MRDESWWVGPAKINMVTQVSRWCWWLVALLLSTLALEKADGRGTPATFRDTGVLEETSRGLNQTRTLQQWLQRPTPLAPIILVGNGPVSALEWKLAG